MAISDQPVPNIVLNGERLKASNENKERGKGAHFPPLFKTTLEISVKTRHEKEIKSVYIVKADVKVSCFV